MVIILAILLLLCASGIKSSTTTYIIAPAAKDNAYGNIGFTKNNAAAPSIPPIGSTNPLN